MNYGTEGFCNQVLARHLWQFDCYIHTIKIAHSRHHGIIDRGGIGKYETLWFDIQSTLKSRKQPGVYFTTMIDLYGLPADFPGKANHVRNPQNPRPYCEALERAFGADIGDARFEPHLQLHEYETLLYCHGARENQPRMGASKPAGERMNLYRLSLLRRVLTRG